MTNTVSDNKFLRITGVSSPEEFRNYCLKDRPTPYVKEFYGAEIPELYEQAEESLTQYFLDDGFPTDICRPLSQTLLFLMSEARVNGVDVSTSTVFAAAIRRPQDWVKQANHSINTGEFTFARLLEELYK